MEELRATSKDYHQRGSHVSHLEKSCGVPRMGVTQQPRCRSHRACSTEAAGSTGSQLYQIRLSPGPRDPGSKGPSHPRRGPTEPGGPVCTKQPQEWASIYKQAHTNTNMHTHSPPHAHMHKYAVLTWHGDTQKWTQYTHSHSPYILYTPRSRHHNRERGVCEDPIPHSTCSYVVLMRAVLKCI